MQLLCSQGVSLGRLYVDMQLHGAGCCQGAAERTWGAEEGLCHGPDDSAALWGHERPHRGLQSAAERWDTRQYKNP